MEREAYYSGLRADAFAARQAGTFCGDKELNMKYLLRLLCFSVGLIVGVTALVGICVLGFQVARATGNVYVIATEGMQVRAANILMPGDEDTGDLTKYFTSQWIESDTELTENNYVGDKITSFDHRVKVESIWAQPWSGKATVTLVETVNTINGSHPTGEVDENGAVEEPCAPWEKRRYQVSCAKLGDAWLIENLQVLETLEPDPTPTPEPVITPTPTVSAEPTATPAQ